MSQVKILMRPGPRMLERLPKQQAGTQFSRFEVRALAPLLGAELSGVDLAGPIDEQLSRELRRALLEWKVIFFRGQHGLTAGAHAALARIWGEPEVNPFIPEGATAEVSRLAKDDKTVGVENIWHSDHSFMAAPARCSVLRALEVPAVGGDTIWADMAAAYDNLPADIKERIAGLEAVHDWVASWGRGMTREQIAEQRKALPPVRHPVVVRHPESGRALLYVNEPFTLEIVGPPREEAEELLQYLVLQARIPEYQVRFHWEPDSVVVWDNIATQHYAVNDYYPQRRVMERIAVAGVPLT